MSSLLQAVAHHLQAKDLLDSQPQSIPVKKTVTKILPSVTKKSTSLKKNPLKDSSSSVSGVVKKQLKAKVSHSISSSTLSDSPVLAFASMPQTINQNLEKKNIVVYKKTAYPTLKAAIEKPPNASDKVVNLFKQNSHRAQNELALSNNVSSESVKMSNNPVTSTCFTTMPSTGTRIVSIKTSLSSNLPVSASDNLSVSRNNQTHFASVPKTVVPVRMFTSSCNQTIII